METFALVLHLMVQSPECPGISPKPESCQTTFQLNFPLETGLTRERCERRLQEERANGLLFKSFVGVPFTTRLHVTCD